LAAPPIRDNIGAVLAAIEAAIPGSYAVVSLPKPAGHRRPVIAGRRTGHVISLGLSPRPAYIPGMAMNPSPRRDAHAPDPVSESKAARAERLARERQQIDEAIASAAVGEVVSEADFDAWVDSLGTDHELPPPRPR
jgi:predicted transcriptional regulator